MHAKLYQQLTSLSTFLFTFIVGVQPSGITLFVTIGTLGIFHFCGSHIGDKIPSLTSKNVVEKVHGNKFLLDKSIYTPLWKINHKFFFPLITPVI